MCITEYAASRRSASIICHVAEAMLRESWSAPMVMLSSKRASWLVTLMYIANVLTINTMRARARMSFEARRCGTILLPREGGRRPAPHGCALRDYRR